MKRIALFFLIIIIIVVGIYYNQEIEGAELATIINRAINENNINEVEKNKKGKFIDNDKNSINIDIKMLDTEETYNMETLYNGGIEKFVQYYNKIKFKKENNTFHYNKHLNFLFQILKRYELAVVRSKTN